MSNSGCTTTTATESPVPAVIKRSGMSHAEIDAISHKDLAVDRVIEIDLKGGQAATPSTSTNENDNDEVDGDPQIDLEPLDNSDCCEEEKQQGEREPMEIEPSRSEDEGNDDLEALLGDVTIGASSENSRRKAKKNGCCARKRVGNVTIVCQSCHSQTGYGIIGPHWFGPLCVLLIVTWASHHFIRKAALLGPISTSICVAFMLGTIFNLLATSFKDPGLVMGRPSEADLADYRWCDFCNVYQPPDGAHCPDCNVCIAGYDHHCIWMGVCIGKGNMKSFVRFNLCWILYLLFSVLWVSIIGPIVMKHFSK